MIRLLLAAAFLAVASVAPVRAADPAPVTGVASWYGPGTGVAVPWCTWTLRHDVGCGSLAVQSHQTGLVVVASVVDWCECYRGTPDERVVDLQWGVLAALGLDRADGLYPVTTWRIDAPAETSGLPNLPAVPDGARVPDPSAPALLPDTAAPPDEGEDRP